MRLGKSLIVTAIVISILSSNNLMMAKDTTTKNTKIEKVVTTKDFKFKDGVITKYVGKGGKVVIPSTINGQKVIKIGDNAFFECSSIKNIKSITIPDSVTSIGYRAFACCENVKSITIPNSVTQIGEDAFGACYNLTNIILSNKLTQIGDGTFAGCKNLTNIIIPNSVTSIGKSAFGGCESLISITIPNSVTSIGEYAFGCCNKLTSITIPDSVMDMGESVFFDCYSLTNITLSNNLTSIGKDTFGFCENLTSITIPNSVISIDEHAFYECKSLTSVIIPDSVTSIAEKAFDGCKSLTNVTIPNSVTSMGRKAFYDCGKLKSINYNGTTYTSINELINSSNGKIQVLTATPADTKDEVESTEEPQVYTDNSPQAVFDRHGKISEIDDSYKQSFKSAAEAKKMLPDCKDAGAQYVYENMNYVVVETELKGNRSYLNGQETVLAKDFLPIGGRDAHNGVIVFKDGSYVTSGTLPKGKTLEDINYYAYSSGKTFLVVKVTDVDMTGMESSR